MKQKKSQQSQLIHLAITIIIPMLIMTKTSDPSLLGPVWSLVVALLFPMGYQAWDWWKNREIDVFSIIGFVSILLTGGIGLLQLDAKRVAIKEAGVPLILGIIVAGSIVMGKSLVTAFLSQALPLDDIEAKLDQTQRGRYDRLLRIFSRGFAGSFLLSAILNYVLAKIMVTAEAGTPEFTVQLGRMTGMSFPAIALPMMIVMMGLMIWFVIRLQKITGQELEELLGVEEKK